MDIAANLVILLGLLAIGVPIPFCFMAAVLFMVILHGYDFAFLLPIGFYSLNSLTLLSVPFFIMLGGLMSSAGIAERLIDIASALTSRIKGALGATTVVGCAIFGAVAGTCTAAVAAIGAIMIPQMEEDGFPRGYATALVACASVLGQLIPPSVPMILFAWVTQTSVAACFLSTVGPGLLLVAIYVVINHIMSRSMPIKVGPRLAWRAQARQVGSASYHGAFALLAPIIVLGSIYGGYATPTESATIAIFYTVIVGFFIYRRLSGKILSNVLVTTATTTGVVVVMVFFVIMLGRVYTMENVPQRMVAIMMGISDNKYVILLMCNLFLIAVGMLMDDFSGTLLATPLLFPIMQHIGVSPYQFAAIMGTNLGLGQVTPPMAGILYMSARMGRCSIDQMIKPALVFVCFGTLPVVIATTYWPDLSLFIPRLVMGIG
jgi:tripartite ATP-independent transporter DctM subunit